MYIDLCCKQNNHTISTIKYCPHCKGEQDGHGTWGKTRAPCWVEREQTAPKTGGMRHQVERIYHIALGMMHLIEKHVCVVYNKIFLTIWRSAPSDQVWIATSLKLHLIIHHHHLGAHIDVLGDFTFSWPGLVDQVWRWRNTETAHRTFSEGLLSTRFAKKLKKALIPKSCWDRTI